MNATYRERASDSPHVENIGSFRAETDYSQVCAADFHSNLLIVKHEGKLSLSIWGPESKSALMEFPSDTEFLFIRFKLGRFMPAFPNNMMIDRGFIFPDASTKSVWLDSSVWEIPTYENADTFVEWLVHKGLLVHDPLVDDVLHDHPLEISPRSIQRRFLQATGMSHRYLRQIERARHALSLLEQGMSILDTVHEAGYFDQSHLTRSMKHFVGQTPSEILHQKKPA